MKQIVSIGTKSTVLWHVHGDRMCQNLKSHSQSGRLQISRGGRLLERGLSKYQSTSLHCGVECSVHARFCGGWPGCFGVIDVTDNQIDRQIRL